MKRLLILIFLFVSAPVLAGDLPPKDEQEIEHLVNYLEQSDCEFYRNGKWYDSKRAVRHINRKYNWLRKRHLVTTTEEFIARAASESSRSGEAYLVRCPNEEAVASAAWLTHELEIYRKPPQAHPKGGAATRE